MLKSPLPRLVGATAPLLEVLRVPRALSYQEFRNYWFGLLLSVTGYQMLVLFALGWLIRIELTADTRYLGYMGTAIAVPAIVLNLFGGVFADKLNPKRLLWLTQSSTGVIVVGLGLLSAFDLVHEWHVLAAAFLIGSVQAFDGPTRQSIFSRLIGREALSSAIALNSSVWTGTRIFAPLAAGIIIGQTGLSPAIFVSAVGFLVFALIARSLKFAPTERAPGSLLSEMLTGFMFIKNNPIFAILIGMTFFSGMFGMSYVLLMPVFADEVFEVGAARIGLLMGGAAVGALTGIIISSNLGELIYRGWLLLVAAALFGVLLVLFGFTSSLKLYWLSIGVLFFADLFASVYLVSVMTTLHSLVPDQFRGRVMGFYGISWSMVTLGGLQASFVAHYGSAPLAVAIGGGLVVALTLGVALFSPRVRALSYSSAA